MDTLALGARTPRRGVGEKHTTRRGTGEMELHVARGPVCSHCEEKLSNGQAFCGKCGQPTRWATHDERVLWDLGQWESSRKNSNTGGKAAASAERSHQLRQTVRDRVSVGAPQQPPTPSAEPGPRRSMLSRFRRPVEPAASAPAVAAPAPAAPAPAAPAPAAPAPAAPAARATTPDTLEQPKPVAPKPSVVAQRPAARPVSPAAKPAPTSGRTPPGSSPASTGAARPSQVARVVRTAASAAPAPAARTNPAGARVATATVRAAGSASAAPAIAPEPVVEAPVQSQAPAVQEVEEAPVETPRSAPGTPLVIIRRSAAVQPPAPVEQQAAVAAPAPAKPKREKKQKPPKAPKQRNVRTETPVAAPKPKKEDRKEAAKRERKHRKHSKRVNRRAASLDLKDGERVSLSIEGWSRFRRATLVVTNFRVALVTQVPPQVKWIPLEEVATVSRRWRGAHSIVVSAPTEVVTLQKSKRDMLASFQELLESEVREARRHGSSRHHPDITQEWCDRATQIWDSRFHRVRLWIRRHPAATIIGLLVIGIGGFTLSSVLTSVFTGGH